MRVWVNFSSLQARRRATAASTFSSSHYGIPIQLCLSCLKAPGVACQNCLNESLSVTRVVTIAADSTRLRPCFENLEIAQILRHLRQVRAVRQTPLFIYCHRLVTTSRSAHPIRRIADEQPTA